MEIDRVLMTPKQIDDRVSCVAAKINECYDKIDKPVLILGVLKGSFMFLSDLARKFTFDNQIEFIRAASYGDKMHSSGKCDIMPIYQVDFKGRDVLIVDDIVDTGITMQAMKDFCNFRVVKSVKTCAFIGRLGDNKADFVGVQLPPDQFVFGYGLDLAHLKRGEPALYGRRRAT